MNKKNTKRYNKRLKINMYIIRIQPSYYLKKINKFKLSEEGSKTVLRTIKNRKVDEGIIEICKLIKRIENYFKETKIKLAILDKL